jgi:hypothetical protein
MIDRRTRTRIVFLGQMYSLVSQVRQWRALRENGESIPLAPRWLVVGAVYRIGYNWAYDCDLGAIRTKRWRRGLLVTAIFTLALLGTRRSSVAIRSASMGATTGRLGYRFWYGVLHPLPGPND